MINVHIRVPVIVSYYLTMIMMIRMTILFCAFETVLTKSRCVAAVIQDATSNPYTINIRMKYWKRNTFKKKELHLLSKKDFFKKQIIMFFIMSV